MILPVSAMQNLRLLDDADLNNLRCGPEAEYKGRRIGFRGEIEHARVSRVLKDASRN